MPPSGAARSGVDATAVPTFEGAGQVVGSAAKVGSGHPVGRLAAIELGRWTDTDLVLASPGDCERLTVMPAGFVALAACVVTVIFGAYGSASQPVAWYGAETSCVAPSLDFSVAPTASGSQLVGLKMKFGRSIATVTVRSRSGIPWRIVGSDGVSIVRCESTGSTLIAARTTTVPRSNGPATAWITMTRPNGPPP